MHFEQMGFHIYVPGHEKRNKVRHGHEYLAPDRITKADMMKWIRRSGIDDETKEALIAEVASHPANTMHHFFKHIHEYIRRIHAAREQKKAEE